MLILITKFRFTNKVCFKAERTQTNNSAQDIFLYISFFTCTCFVSSAESIEPIARRLRTQHLAGEL